MPDPAPPSGLRVIALVRGALALLAVIAAGAALAAGRLWLAVVVALVAGAGLPLASWVAATRRALRDGSRGNS
jgi:hypothetical protein